MFETHILNETGFREVKKAKTILSIAVDQALELMPDGREKSVFKTKIEEAMFFATKSIAGKTGNWTDIIRYEASNSVIPQEQNQSANQSQIS